MAEKNRIAKRVQKSLLELDRGDFDEALLHASIAVDATSKREYPRITRNAERYKSFLAQQKNMNIITGVMFVGMPVAGLHFGSENKWTSLEKILYERIRCSLLHESKFPENVAITAEGKVSSETNLVTLPFTVIVGLLMAVVGSEVNRNEHFEKGFDYQVGFRGQSWKLGSMWGMGDRILADLLAIRVSLNGTPPKEFEQAATQVTRTTELDTTVNAGRTTRNHTAEARSGA